MDSLILRHFELLSEYAALQHDLGKQAATAFITLGRARYHGIKLSTDEFRPELIHYVHVTARRSVSQVELEKIVTVTDVQEKSSKQEEQEKESVQPKSIPDLTDSLAKASLEPPDEADLEDDQSSSDLSAEEPFCLERLAISTDKKNNPMRSIETLPSADLRATQSAFQTMLRTSVELANVFAELQTVQSLLGLHESQTAETATDEQVAEHSNGIEADTPEINK